MHARSVRRSDARTTWHVSCLPEKISSKHELGVGRVAYAYAPNY